MVRRNERCVEPLAGKERVFTDSAALFAFDQSPPCSNTY